MLCTNIVMIQATGFINGKLNHFFGTRGEADLTEDYAVPATNDKFNGTANFIQLDAEVTLNFSSNAFPFSDESKQKMFRANIIVLEALCFLLGETQDFASPLRKLVKPISIIHLCVTPLSKVEGGTEPSESLR
jgi:hypothetical protein